MSVWLFSGLHASGDTDVLLTCCMTDASANKVCKFQELNEKQTAHMVWCLMDFLAFMHSKGIMHRDLKPENILMSSKEKEATIRVVDFGTADFCAPNQRLFHKYGTVLYVAPEVRLG